MKYKMEQLSTNIVGAAALIGKKLLDLIRML